MVDTTQLASELEQIRHVSMVEDAATDGVVKFWSDWGEKNAITSEMMSVLEDHNCALYPKEDDGKYYAVV